MFPSKVITLNVFTAGLLLLIPKWLNILPSNLDLASELVVVLLATKPTKIVSLELHAPLLMRRDVIDQGAYVKSAYSV